MFIKNSARTSLCGPKLSPFYSLECRRLIQYQLFFFNRTLHERGSKLEIPDFVCVRMLDANFFDLGKMSIFFIFGGLDPEYYNTRIDINIVYVHMLGAKHFLFLKISCFDFFCRKTCLKHNMFTPTKRLSSRYIHILAVPNKRIDLFEKPCSFQFFSTSKQSSVFEEFASHHVADDDMHVLFCMKYCKNENKIL